MSEQKMFTKKKLGATSSNITAVNIYEKNLITGDDKGNIIIYQLKKSELKTIKKFKLESQIEKICISHDKKIAFILSAALRKSSVSPTKLLLKSFKSIPWFSNSLTKALGISLNPR